MPDRQTEPLPLTMREWQALKPEVAAVDNGERGTTLGELLTDEQASELLQLVDDIDRAAESLPADELAEYEENQESIVDARRSAELHEGLLQVD
jgi:hypothetical protein